MASQAPFTPSTNPSTPFFGFAKHLVALLCYQVVQHVSRREAALRACHCD